MRVNDGHQLPVAPVQGFQHLLHRLRGEVLGIPGEVALAVRVLLGRVFHVGAECEETTTWVARFWRCPFLFLLFDGNPKRRTYPSPVEKTTQMEKAS